MYRLRRLVYVEPLHIKVLLFSDIQLPANASDEEVWQICQANGFYLLTGNRSAKDGEASLHAILGRLANDRSVPVITISSLERVLNDPAYCQACAESIARILSNAELYLGVPRLYIP